MIYGNNLEVYSIINTLLESGFPPYKILHARPNTSTPCSSNPVVLDCLNVGMKDCGIKTWTDLTLKGWVLDQRGKLVGVRLAPEKDRLSSGMVKEERGGANEEGGGANEEGDGANEEGDGANKEEGGANEEGGGAERRQQETSVEEYTVPCQALIYMDEKYVDMQAFKGM